MLKQLLARKTDFNEPDDTHGPTLRRTLGPWGLTALGIGAVIGGGIFVITGQAAADHAGPAVILSFILAAICSTFTALRSEEHTSELQSLMRISYAVFCLKKKNKHTVQTTNKHYTYRETYQ